MRKAAPTIRIAVSIKRKQWFVHPPRNVLSDFKKTHKHGVCIYSATGKDDSRLVKTLHEITGLILSKHPNKP